MSLPTDGVGKNFKKIADLWGYLICLGKSILRTETFDSMKLLIETDILAFIEDDIILTIEELGFKSMLGKLALHGLYKRFTLIHQTGMRIVNQRMKCRALRILTILSSQRRM